MNPKLAESLASAIASLNPDDYAIFQTALIHYTLQKTPGICGGQARIRETRIPVWTLISLHHQGATEQELLSEFPMLTLFDLFMAHCYYRDHPSEIDAAIADNTD